MSEELLVHRRGTLVADRLCDRYTTSFAFFEALWELGIRYVFVNLGSDHPSIIEAIVKGQREKRNRFPRIITCPNEMVAMSLADGYARYSSMPQCVLVHVDVGTLNLGAAIHNAACGRAPVLIFAGLSPFTLNGELRGSRTEYIHWIQDVPDQKQILGQYCKYTAELKTGRNVKEMVGRALQFAGRGLGGIVYLCGAREVMEEEITPYELQKDRWGPVGPGALPTSAVEEIAEAIANAKDPLLLTGYSGRDHACVSALVQLAETVKGLQVLDTGGSDMCFPATHRASLGLFYGVHPKIKTADVIIVLDCDVPWIPTQCRPSDDAKIYHIDVDPLKTQMPVFYIPTLGRWKADSCTAISQILDHISSHQDLASKLSSPEHQQKWEKLGDEYTEKRQAAAERAAGSDTSDDATFDIHHLCAQIRAAVPEDTIFAVEAVTNTQDVHDQLQPSIPGSWINCGGGGLGWSGGGAMGIKLAADDIAAAAKAKKRDASGAPANGAVESLLDHVTLEENKPEPGAGRFVCQIVGDGTFLFSVPGSVYWIAARYKIPVLTIVLNNQGWNAPRKSLLLVHPDGEGSKVSNEELNIAFTPTPDYAGIAEAAGKAGNVKGLRAGTKGALGKALREAVEMVRGGRSVVLDAHLGGSQDKVV